MFAMEILKKIYQKTVEYFQYLVGESKERTKETVKQNVKKKKKREKKVLASTASTLKINIMKKNS